MIKRYHVFLFVLVLVAFPFILPGSFQAVNAAEDAPLLGPRPMPRILFPINYAIIESTQFEVIAVAPERENGDWEPLTLRVDGKEHLWEAFAPPNYIERLELTPGRHTLAVNQVQLTVFVAAQDIERPKDWPVARRHPVKETAPQDCQACHGVTEEAGRKTLGGFTGAAACDACHQDKPCPGMGEHARKEPLRACNLCHAVHGALGKALLVAPREQLCTKCHDATGR